MNRIVREHYPVADLPETLKEGLPAGSNVRVTIEVEIDSSEPEKVMSLEELFAMRRPPYKTIEDIVAEIRRDRGDPDE